MEKVFFIGLGHMGNPMARNLLRAGYPLAVYDINAKAVQALADEGAQAITSVAAGVKDADVIVTMLQTTDQVKDTCLAPLGIFAHAKKNALYIDSSSIDIAVTRELHALAKKSGIRMLDSPVSGGVSGAESANLTFMVGGDEKHFAAAKPIYETMGKKIVYVGEDGLGQAAKICNNLILGISMIAVSEGFSLAEKLGLNPQKFYEIASNASSRCWSMTNNCPAPDVVPEVPANHGYRPGFMAKMMLKDLMLGVQAAETAQAAIPLGNMAAELYALFVEQGCGEMDFSGIIKMIDGME